LLLLQTTGTQWDLRTLVSDHPWLRFVLAAIPILFIGLVLFLRQQDAKRRQARKS
jgi:hypothetical protein